MFEAVPDGGLLVYYENRGAVDASNGGPGLRAFPPGLRMVSGDPQRRARRYTTGEGSQAELAERAVEWECLRYTTGGAAAAGYNSVDNGESCRLRARLVWEWVVGISVDTDGAVGVLAIQDQGSRTPIARLVVLAIK
ncbi:hypothetical protein JR316_0011783 [Psilocybe cubensis]|uniref:Uncharacterized protein n=1 Tax=Psilocybe cubensis TaxID=181762 RepID=A0ACB8GLD6_PSICU|nr:hypothetical protein JR316_0011783 [Psilocybe cubensis]KAH9476212.1 hypothetical protein JR316_0011783 [Psilocybe cubensis]